MELDSARAGTGLSLAFVIRTSRKPIQYNRDFPVMTTVPSCLTIQIAMQVVQYMLGLNLQIKRARISSDRSWFHDGEP